MTASTEEGQGIRVSRLELLAGAGFVLLLAVGVLRIATPGRDALRPVSIQGVEIPSEPIASGQALMREREWRPGTDVYVVGWNYSLGSLHAAPELLLRHGDTVLFLGPKGGAGTENTAFLPGLGYRLQANEPLTLRLTITNTGPAGETQGARALVYFVPVAGN